MQSPRISVVVPTFQRRDIVVATVASLTRQRFAAPYEVIVVDDGSTDGTAEALQQLDIGVPLTVVQQPNGGAASARNAGAARARGEILLFIDDDMEAHPSLLAEHDHSHRQGADAVLGHFPLHPGAPRNLLSDSVRGWVNGRLLRLIGTPPEALTLHDFLTGQISVTRAVFVVLGGFNGVFTAGGSFGNEDTDFGYRLLREGYKVVFNPNAITWQNYVVTPAAHLRQWRQAGRADVAFAREHPEQQQTIFRLNGADRWMNRWLWRPLVALEPVTMALTWGLRVAALRLFKWGSGHGFASRCVATLFFNVRRIEYWKGVREAGGMPERHLIRVLCYHAIEDLGGERQLREYGVPSAIFREQISSLIDAGYRFISTDDLLRYLSGGESPPTKAVLLTFDDAFASVKEIAPFLCARRIPAVVFAVSGQLGGINAWDAARTVTARRLMTRDDLQALAAAGMEIGCHSRTHADLPRASDRQLDEEIRGSAEDLVAAGFTPRLFAYPYGEHDPRVRDAVERAGFAAAFTVTPGMLGPGDEPFQLPRIEILRSDTGRRFLRKIRMTAPEPVASPVAPSPHRALRPQTGVALAAAQPQKISRAS